ncbi:uncharacterized protein LOC6579095 [Drosophila mojavensis]|uniref:Uncharacterized protein n=1 Tax=Drosophila mojavensis TaxID=7230 RepID=B4KNG8_DROMO|nr:uncharacterized protein LOC6579095 [Drosophila mojavensis]EDW08927.2 uncharacterized protein Dmoj_GI19302 [Drosophila mojavensis]
MGLALSTHCPLERLTANKVREMEAFIISISICISLFILVSIISLIVRTQKARNNVGFVITDANRAPIPPGGIAATHGQAAGLPSYYPPPGYQTHVYSPAYVYPAQAVSQIQVQVQGIPAPINSVPPSYQRAVNEGNPTNAELNILPANLEKSLTQQTQRGAVETVSQI